MLCRFAPLCAASFVVAWCPLVIGADEIGAIAEVTATSRTTRDIEVATQLDDRYSVPDGDVGELLQFVSSLKRFRPRTADEFLENRKRLPAALRTAAKRILRQEKDRTSPAARTATELLLGLRIYELQRSNPREQRAVFEDLKAHLSACPELTLKELSLAFTVASTFERIQNIELAREAFTTFGDLFASQENQALARHGEKLQGVARRLNLLGTEVSIAGKTVAGEQLAWERYRGKVVLVDFWATWCRPCIRDMAELRRYHEEYHQQGFEVVGISVDTDREALEAFLSDQNLPWETLFEDGAGWDHPMAVHYGVMGVPSLMLIDRDGTVVSVDPHQRQLEEQLVSLFERTSSGRGNGGD